ncbi:MAG TPA: Txe/YoeB family addiction module toxin [Caulobacteraceae bacterium]|nr:Txe/YoeB family addiction module toxin [Caulobacteraceae bacterium]
MRISFSSRSWNEYVYWQKADQGVLERLNALIKECSRHPFTGIGKPEPLKGEMRGWWSRRITVEDRLIYRVTGKGEDQELEIAQCRYHY